MHTYDWSVIGAGPAGIAAVGQLIDHQQNPTKIAWIDPHFTVGDFGTKWRKVPSNTKVSTFIDFLNSSHAFRYNNCQQPFAIHDIDPDDTCQLQLMVDPLLWITDQLKQQVNTFTTHVQRMTMVDRQWEITLENKVIRSNNVILAIGAEPKTLSLSATDVIPLEHTFDTDMLVNHCTENDTVAVFGSSHSAILIIRNLIEHCHVKKIINFYQSPLRYAIYLENEILFDDTGLKGTTADWAREHIDGKLPVKLVRVLSTAENLHHYLPECTKSIHAIGFKKRSVLVEGITELVHNDKTGIIAPGLFGLGIAFPEAKIDRFGNLEYRVGLRKFMQYLKRVMPIWLQ